MDILLQEIDNKLSELEKSIATRAAKTFEEYNFLCGKYSALVEFRHWLVDYEKSTLSKIAQDD